MISKWGFEWKTLLKPEKKFCQVFLDVHVFGTKHVEN